jgi:hypothetical protein
MWYFMLLLLPKAARRTPQAVNYTKFALDAVVAALPRNDIQLW